MLTPGGVTGYWATGNPPKASTFTFPDEYTINIKFVDPKPMFIDLIGRQQMWFPAHWMKEFHMDTTSDKAGLEAKVKAAGSASWDKWFIDDRQYWYTDPAQPVLTAWTVKEAMGKDLFVMNRNPYFYGVDSAGNQLPYLDQVTHRLFAENNVFNLWITNGEIDFQARHVSSAAADYTLYKQGEAKGDYKVFKGVSASHVAVQLNLAVKNAKLNEFFNTRDVRIGLSYAIDRDKINELVYAGLATPRQYSPIKSSPQYYEKLTNAYIKYDVAEANKRLDAAGYKKGADGFRTFKDGSALSFTIEGTDNVGTPQEDSYQQIVKMFGAVGVKCAYKYVERALYTQHYEANDIEAAVWGGDRTVLPLIPEAIIFRGVQPDRPWSAGYAQYYNRGASDPGAVKPPEGHFINKIWDIWGKVASEVDPAKRNDLFKQILDIWAEELPMIGVLGELPAFAIVKNGFKNFVQGFPMDDTTGDEEVYNAETYYWDDPTKHPVM
jgi:peptide/nickel transport system substrate-binding protein